MTDIKDLLDDEVVTKITNLNVTNVDLVGHAANGRTFLLRKSAGDPSIFDADQVREFAKQALEGDMDDDALVKADDEILEDAPAGADGDVNDPGSPAWEAVDAATAWSQLSLLSEAKRAIQALSNREAEEAFNGDDDGFDNSWDLQAACDAIDCAIALVAPYAVGEQDESEQVEKSAREPRVVLEEFVKAGRSLSAANESALRGAAAAINNVLSSLPPVEDVMKESVVDEDVVKAEEPLEEEAVEKAKSDPQVLVYDANGNVIGSVDPTNLTTFANSASPDAPADDAPTEDASADAPAAASDDSAPAVVATDVADDAAPDAAVIPGTDTVQSPVEADDENVTKASSNEIVDAFKEALAPFAKQLGENSELAEVVKGLQERVAKLSAEPDDRKSPRLNGATSSGDAFHDAPVDGLAPLRKAVDEAVGQDEVIKSRQALAVASLLERFKN